MSDRIADARPGEDFGAYQCPVCRRFTHTKDCPVRDTMSLEWVGTTPDQRERDHHSPETP